MLVPHFTVPPAGSKIGASTTESSTNPVPLTLLAVRFECLKDTEQEEIITVVISTNVGNPIFLLVFIALLSASPFYIIENVCYK